MTVYAYATDSGSNVVSVIDTSTNSVVTTISVGTDPRGLAFSADLSKLYVTNYGDGTVSVINTSTNSVTTTFSAPDSPVAFAETPDGAKVLVVSLISTGNQQAKIYILDSSTYSVISAPQPGSTRLNDIAIAPDGSYALVTGYQTFNPGLDYVYVVDLAFNSVVATIELSNFAVPEGVAISPDSSLGYVIGNGAIFVIDVANRTVIDTANISCEGDIAILSNGSAAYASDTNGNVVKLIDLSNLSVSATVSVGTGPFQLSLTPDNAQLYVVNSGADTISVIATATNTVSTTITTAGTQLFGVIAQNSALSESPLVRIDAWW